MSAIINYQELYQYEKDLRISLEKELEIEKIKVKKLLSGKLKRKICPKCLNDVNDSSEI